VRGHGAKFGKKKEEAIVALLTQRTVEDAARAVGTAASTLFRWLEEPEFKTAYLEARRAAYTQAIARMQQATGMAVSVLVKVMLDPASPASTRVRAADSVIDPATKAIEIEDIEVRVSELERAAKLDNK
jgi:transposase-like protein